jgi:hypothetical protein
MAPQSDPDSKMPGKNERDPKIWVDQYADFLYRFALAQIFMLREMEGLNTEDICNSMEISATI